MDHLLENMSDNIDGRGMSWVLSMNMSVLGWFGQTYDQDFVLETMTSMANQRLDILRKGEKASSRAAKILRRGRTWRRTTTLIHLSQDLLNRARVTGSREYFDLAEQIIRFAIARSQKRHPLFLVGLHITLGSLYRARLVFDPDLATAQLCELSARQAMRLLVAHEERLQRASSVVMMYQMCLLITISAVNFQLRFAQPERQIQAARELIAEAEALLDDDDGVLPTGIRVGLLSEKAALHLTQVNQSGDYSLLDDAIAALDQARTHVARNGGNIDLVEVELQRAEALNLRADVRLTAGQIEHVREDMEATISALDTALLNSIPGSPWNVRVLLRYAVLATEAWLSDADRQRYDDVFDLIWRVCCDIPLDDRLLAMQRTRRWAQALEAWHSPAAAAEAYERAFAAWRDLTGEQPFEGFQEFWLSHASGLPAWTAHALAMAGELRAAVEVADAGRARIHSGPDGWAPELSALEDFGHGAHRRAFNAVARALAEQNDAVPDSGQDNTLRGQLDENERESLFLGMREVRARYQAVVRDIRAIPGFEPFPRIFHFEQLAVLADQHPLVYVVPGNSAGGLLILHPGADDPQWISLPELNWEAVETLGGRYVAAYQSRSHSDEDWARWADTLTDACAWLWPNVVGPLLEALDGHSFVRVVAYGALNILPLHAAYNEAPDGTVEFALDRMAFAYTPSGRLLYDALERKRPTAKWRMLAVDNPSVADVTPLAFGDVELSAVRSAFPDLTELSGAEVNLDSLCEQLMGHNIVHLSAHGFADLMLPRNSGVRLAGSELLTARILAQLDLSHMELVVLSSCESALAGGRALDEMITLPGTLHAATGCTVVGSLWVAHEEATSALFECFYGQWDQQHSTASIAMAMRDAQLHLRDHARGMHGETFQHPAYWAPFVTYG